MTQNRQFDQTTAKGKKESSFDSYEPFSRFPLPNSY